MFGLRVLLLGLLAVSLWGQSDTNAVPNPGQVIHHAVQGLVQSSLLGTSHPVILPGPLPAPFWPGRTTKCAVPLLEAPIAAEKNFVIAQLRPPKDFTDDMTVARALPACPGAKE
jgi:hypothetical protein